MAPRRKDKHACGNTILSFTYAFVWEGWRETRVRMWLLRQGSNFTFVRFIMARDISNGVGYLDHWFKNSPFSFAWID